MLVGIHGDDLVFVGIKAELQCLTVCNDIRARAVGGNKNTDF
jgi:hypothetical protein